MAILVTNHDKRLETRTLTSSCLFLHWHDLHNFVLELRAQKLVDDLVLLDWERVQVDFLNLLDFSIFYQAAELRNRHPLFFVALAAGASRGAIASATTGSSSTFTATTTPTTATTPTPYGRRQVSETEKIAKPFAPIGECLETFCTLEQSCQIEVHIFRTSSLRSSCVSHFSVENEADSDRRNRTLRMSRSDLCT